MAKDNDQSAAALFPACAAGVRAARRRGARGPVGPRGDIAWMCAPRWDSDAVFSSLLGGAGCYAVTPDERFVWGGYYEDGSLIWRSRWITAGGTIECREALAYPGDARTAVLLRRIEAADTAVRIRVLLDVRAGFGHHRMTRLQREGTIWTARSGPLQLRWSGGGAGPAARRTGAWNSSSRSAPGARHDLVLEVSDQDLAAEPAAAGRAWEATQAAWSAAMPGLRGNLAPVTPGTPTPCWPG